MFVDKEVLDSVRMGFTIPNSTARFEDFDRLNWDSPSGHSFIDDDGWQSIAPFFFLFFRVDP